MRKGLLQSVGHTVSGQIFGLDVYDPLQRGEAEDTEFSNEWIGSEQKVKTLKEKNKRL
ncbi:MAG TPA: hypothetical protein VFT51_13395 [Bacillales bacterium]|nr:hypothetical protein [Bacillales bacterium]